MKLTQMTRKWLVTVLNGCATLYGVKELWNLTTSAIPHNTGPVHPQQHTFEEKRRIYTLSSTVCVRRKFLVKFQARRAN